MMNDIRKDKNMTQQQLSNLTGISVGMIRHYEQGTKNINHARLETLLKISDALQCQLSDILTDKDLIEQCKVRSI